MARNPKAEVVTFGAAQVRIVPRKDGRWILRWQEAKRDKATTAATLEKARVAAKKKAKELASGVGARMVTALEAEAISRLQDLCGNRSVTGVMDMLADAVKNCGGWSGVSRAIDAWVSAGHGSITPCPARDAVARFLNLHAGSAVLYRGGLRKELEAYAKRYGDVMMADLTEAMLKAWISRPKEDGDPPGPRFFNNRLDTWKTFLNRCRQWHVIPRGVPHPAELIPRQKEEDRVPDIWTIAQGTKALKAVQEELPESLNYLVTGCWLGLRPFEMRRLKDTAWDWDLGYVDVGAHVARKVMQQRFVPIPPNVRAILGGKIRPAGRKRICVRSDDQTFVGNLLKAKGIIDEWPQDVMRHSYISYRLAEGHGRGQVAEWAGNSESEIRKSYRRPLRKEDGAAWFKIGL
jgi:integrase